MKFPNASDIASVHVVSININQSISSAIEKMIINEHRDIVVKGEEKFFILRALEVIKIYQDKINLNEPLSKISLIEVPAVHKNVNILDMLQYLEEETEYICVVDDNNKLCGIITHTDITSNIDPEILMNNYKVDDFLKLIRRIKWVKKDMKTSDVLNDMFTNSFESVIVVQDLKPVGILTTKDIVKLIKEQADLSKPLYHFMVTPVETVNKNISIKEALEFIKSKHYKRVVVTDDDGILAGVVTQKELISLTYTNWSLMMREHQKELQEINTMLKNKNKEYELLASKDPLTGLYNRYKFEQLYYSSLQHIRQRDGSISLIMLDIDYFKKINDTYGHNMGDKVLKEIGHILTTHLRDIDIICRWGGEEFVILLPAVHKSSAIAIAEKLKLIIQNTRFGNIKQVTASFGVTEIENYSRIEQAIEQADKALYLAKNSGRNCVKTL